MRIDICSIASSTYLIVLFNVTISFRNETGNFEVESVVFNSPPMFFQGELCARSPSPFGLF